MSVCIHGSANECKRTVFSPLVAGFHVPTELEPRFPDVSVGSRVQKTKLKRVWKMAAALSNINRS